MHSLKKFTEGEGENVRARGSGKEKNPPQIQTYPTSKGALEEDPR